MRNKCVQMSLEDIYNDISKSKEDNKPALIELLESHINFKSIIPAGFYNAFYQRYGRSHICHPERFVRSLVLQKLLGISTDALLLSILKLSAINGHFCYALKIRLYPGIPRDTLHWNNLYRHRVVIKRTINLMKDTFALDARKSFRSVTAKADTYLSAITQLVGVLLADSIHNLCLFKSLRKLIA